VDGPLDLRLKPNVGAASTESFFLLW